MNAVRFGHLEGHATYFQTAPQKSHHSKNGFSQALTTLPGIAHPLSLFARVEGNHVSIMATNDQGVVDHLVVGNMDLPAISTVVCELQNTNIGRSGPEFRRDTYRPKQYNDPNYVAWEKEDSRDFHGKAHRELILDAVALARRTYEHFHTAKP